MKENWQTISGFPPLYVDVLDRKVYGSREKCWIKNYHPELGQLHKGWTGNETIVYRVKKDNKLIPVKYVCPQ